MPISLHSHSGQFCQHAQGTLENVVQSAIRSGFTTYGLSEHMPRNRPSDLYLEEQTLGVDQLLTQFEGFVIEANRLKSKYQSQINLPIGVETEAIQDEITFPLLQELLDHHQSSIDYLVGSVHHVNQIPIDYDQATFHQACRSLTSIEPFPEPPHEQTLYELCSHYFEAQYRLMVRFQPEVIGHFDLCLLYYPDLDLLKHQALWDKIKRNVKFAISYGALFEVNSAALKKGWKTPYPSPAILNLIARLDGRLTLSDDSHGPHQVGLNYDGVLSYLNQHHIRSLWFLQPVTDPTSDMENIMLPRRRVRALMVPGQWCDNPFWARASQLPTSAVALDTQ